MVTSRTSSFLGVSHVIENAVLVQIFGSIKLWMADIIVQQLHKCFCAGLINVKCSYFVCNNCISAVNEKQLQLTT